MIRIIDEETKSKRISRYKEFDNGYVIHSDWKDMSSDEAEELARKASLKNPDDVFYVAYDDLMNASSDLRWINGKSYHYSDVGVRYGKPYIKSKDAVTESFSITSRDYERSHGKLPRGTGSWAFKFYPTKNKDDEYGDIEFFNGSYSDAKKQAKEYGMKNEYISADTLG